LAQADGAAQEPPIALAQEPPIAFDGETGALSMRWTVGDGFITVLLFFFVNTLEPRVE